MSQPFSYATPLTVDNPDDCFFYHRLNIPGHGEVGTQWDLRACIDNYLGKFNYRGKRVLDLGAAAGYLTFEMEKRGAEVVSFDMVDGTQWDVVPRWDIQKEMPTRLEQQSKGAQRLKNAYWFAHKHLQSKARAYYGDIYDLPGGLGEFDVAMFGMILSHLRDPFQALYSASRLVKETIIITNQMMETKQPIASFIPTRANDEKMAWWSLSRGCLTQMLELLGFAVQGSVDSKPLCLVKGRQQPEPCTSLIARRVAGTTCLTGSAQKPKLAA
jgi:SAM-dependent methyltransferase